MNEEYRWWPEEEFAEGSEESDDSVSLGEAKLGVNEVLDSISLGEAKRRVNAAAEKGTICLCCQQHVKIYRRKLNSNMAEFLCSLVRVFRTTQDWVPFKDCKFTGRDYPYIAFWGLAETKPNNDEAKKNSGLWRPTQKGIDFIGGRVSVPSHGYFYNTEVREWSKTPVYLRDVFDRHFDYSELMGEI